MIHVNRCIPVPISVPAHLRARQPLALPSRHLSCLKVSAITLLAGTLYVPDAPAAGDTAAGKAAWYRTCERCHGDPTPRSKDAFSDYGTTANKLSVYANDPAAITKAANEGYTVPEGNTNDKVPVGGNSSTEMRTFAGMAPDRLGYGTTPTQYAMDISAYFASLYSPPAPPVITAVDTGAGYASVSFSDAKSELPILSYTITAQPGGQQVSGSASPLTISGLSSATDYTFRVLATSKAGSGKPSAGRSASILPAAGTGLRAPVAIPATPAVAVIPPTLSMNSPSVTAASVKDMGFDLNGPTILRARAGDASAKVYFSTSADILPRVTGYTVYATTQGRMTGHSAQGSKSPLTLSGLSNGTEYTLTVVAHTNDGHDLRSSPSEAVTPLAILGD